MFMKVKKFLPLFSPVQARTKSFGMGWTSVACRLVLQSLLKSDQDAMQVGERGEGGGREEHTMETGIVSQEWSLRVTGHFKNLSKLLFTLLMHVNQFLCLEKKTCWRNKHRRDQDWDHCLNLLYQPSYVEQANPRTLLLFTTLCYHYKLKQSTQ